MTANLANRYGSPRTPERPFAFTVTELLRGSGIAFLLFNIAGPVIAAVYVMVFAVFGGEGLNLGYLSLVILAPLFLVPYSIGGYVVGLPLAAAVGMLLRPVRRRAIHLLVFGALGAFVGLGTTAVFYQASWVPRSSQSGESFGLDTVMITSLPNYVLMAVLTAAACALGWWWGCRAALREDTALDDKTVARPAVDLSATSEIAE